VHILSADLTTRKRTMQPLKPMIWGLRKFDLERTAACMGAGHEGPVQGFMSPRTKIYLVSRLGLLEDDPSLTVAHSLMLAIT
jgi:hypothetical protein